MKHHFLLAFPPPAKQQQSLLAKLRTRCQSRKQKKEIVNEPNKNQIQDPSGSKFRCASMFGGPCHPKGEAHRQRGDLAVKYMSRSKRGPIKNSKPTTQQPPPQTIDIPKDASAQITRHTVGRRIIRQRQRQEELESHESDVKKEATQNGIITGSTPPIHAPPMYEECLKLGLFTQSDISLQPQYRYDRHN